jgi:hypothetical protein
LIIRITLIYGQIEDELKRTRRKERTERSAERWPDRYLSLSPWKKD